MAEVGITPVAGVNNVARDDDMVRGPDAPGRFVRDAVNVDIHADGAFSMRGAARKISGLKLRDVWQSPLHGDVFCVHEGNLCKLDTGDFSVSVLVRDAGAGRVWYAVVNNAVFAATDRGIFVYDGLSAQRLCIDTPPAPAVMPSEGSLAAGHYGFALAWLRGGKEGGLSAMASVAVADGGGVEVVPPFCTDNSIDGVRLYATAADGGELACIGDYPVSGAVVLPLLPKPGKAAQMRFLSPMPTGKFMCVWRGRLLTAKANVLRFSEPLAFHLHDGRFGYMQMPQRITFVEPAGGGIFVGQVDGVVFLRGADMEALEMVRLAVKPPVAMSSVRLDADEAGRLSNGVAVCLWLADNGAVAGLPDGGTVELHSGILRGIGGGPSAKTVCADRRVVSLLLDS